MTYLFLVFGDMIIIFFFSEHFSSCLDEIVRMLDIYFDNASKVYFCHAFLLCAVGFIARGFFAFRR